MNEPAPTSIACMHAAATARAPVKLAAAVATRRVRAGTQALRP